ncbi:MAG: (Fe-S)-binding protein [Dehalococcoidia bacterium]|nr:(Fe-S)-binding protein [Dehalococcoidia bacterium]
MSPLSESYGIVPGFAIFLLILLVALSIFAYRLNKLYRYLRMGKPDQRLGNLDKRLWTTLWRVFPQICTLREVSPKDRAGLGHFFIFWGFLFFSVSYLFLVADAIKEESAAFILGAGIARGFYTVLEVLGLLVMLAVLVAVFRRYVLKPKRLSQTADAAYILSFIFLLMATNFLMEGFRRSMGEAVLISTPVAGALAQGFSGMAEGTNRILYQVFWWLHIGLLLGFLAYIPHSKHLHILVSPFNIFFRSQRPKGALSPVNLEGAETFGVPKLQDFTWKQLMDLYSCTECGRCQENCPAYLSGKVLSPKKIIVDMKEHLITHGADLLAKAPEGESKLPALIGEVVAEQAIWDCTTCRACQERCPVFIEHIDKIIDMRRNLVLEQSRFPETTGAVLKCLEARGHTCRGTTLARTDWYKGQKVKSLAENKGVDLLYWVGCAASLEERNTKVAVAFAKIMKAAGINFGVLGTEETCCGEPARRIGNEYLFQMLAQQNIGVMKGYGVKKIVTTCPHCFNTIKNEYPQFGGEFEVVHHTQYIAELLRQNKLGELKEMKKIAAYHDSCYLGRHNDIYEAPRKVLSHVPGLAVREVAASRTRGLCCGGGGGHFWIEETGGKKISDMRLEQLLETKPELITANCPYCIQMFEDAVKNKGKEESLKVMDLAEVVASLLKK